MIKLLIVDDEPLVQAGIKSMIDWTSMDISVVGTASNGGIAYDLICDTLPDIVLTDIRMPVMTGLELARKCHDEGKELPVFVMLTSYEEFQYVKEAMSYDVVDYLIKLELTEESLRATLERAIEKVNNINAKHNTIDSPRDSAFLLKERFFTKALLNLFDSEDQFFMQARNLNLDFSYDAYAAGYIEIINSGTEDMPFDKELALYTSSLQMINELLMKYVACHIVSLDTKHFGIIFLLNGEDKEASKDKITDSLNNVSVMLSNYYKVSIRAGIGSIVTFPMMLSSSYQEARDCFAKVTADNPVIFFSEDDVHSSSNLFNFSLFKDDLLKAYSEYDAGSLKETFDIIIDLFKKSNGRHLQALDAAGNILYLSLSMLSDGEQLLNSIFSDRPNGYRSLYKLSSTEQLIDWLIQLRDGLCAHLTSSGKSYRNHTVIQVKKYINEHISEKLSLNMIAEAFSISPNYLSILFSKYSDIGFSDYVNQSKIDAAKKMLSESDRKIYEISDELGFESSYYFSRVFKKVTGMSPRDYLNTLG